MEECFRIDRYSDSPRIEIVTRASDGCIIRPDGSRTLALGDVFPSFDEAKEELERRAWVRLTSAEKELDDAEEFQSAARELVP